MSLKLLYSVKKTHKPKESCTSYANLRFAVLNFVRQSSATQAKKRKHNQNFDFCFLCLSYEVFFLTLRYYLGVTTLAYSVIFIYQFNI